MKRELRGMLQKDYGKIQDIGEMAGKAAVKKGKR